MTRLFPTRLLAALCILAFGLGQAVSTLGVRCQRGSGETRFELACVKTSQGSCSAEAVDDACCGGSNERRDETPVEPSR